MVIVVHCNGWFLSEWGGITTWSAGRGMMVGGIRALIQSLTCIGVDCFVLISGYFSIRPKLKSIVNLYSIMVFFYLVCYALSIWVGKATFSWHQLGHKFLAFSSGGNWFVQCYLFLMLLSPMLNVFVDRCTEKSLLIYIGIYMACMFYFSAIWDSTYFYFNNGYSVTTFVGIYLVGRYVRLYGLERCKKKPKWVWLAAFVVCILVMTAIRFISSNAERWLSYASPLLILSAAALLVCFAQVRFQSRFVNWIAPSCLAVFIFHTCNPIINWLIRLDVDSFNTKSFGMYLLIMGGGICAVYVIAVLLDSGRRMLMKPIDRLIDRFV